MRIEKENHKFARRLFESQGNIKKSVHDKHHQAMESYRNNITKVKKVKPNYMMDISMMSKTNRLPPLHTSGSNSIEYADRVA